MQDILTPWHPALETVLQQDFWQKLQDFLREEQKHHTLYPAPQNWFRAFKLCDFDTIKVVILGQDPYHGAGQADGLCFSVPEGVKIPPSLRNIFKEIETDFGTKPTTTDLGYLAHQGVLLLNTVLTVRNNEAGSHRGQGWEIFTDEILKLINHHKQHVVFLLWGKDAMQKEHLIDAGKHLILTSAHPSPLSAYRGFFGNHHFSKTNADLQKMGQKAIAWHKM